VLVELDLGQARMRASVSADAMTPSLLDDLLDDGPRAFERHALHVEAQAAQAAQLLAAAGAPGPPWTSMGSTVPGPGEASAILALPRKTRPWYGRDAEHGLAREGGVLGVDGRDEPAAAARRRAPPPPPPSRVRHEVATGPNTSRECTLGRGRARSTSISTGVVKKPLPAGTPTAWTSALPNTSRPSRASCATPARTSSSCEAVATGPCARSPARDCRP
jgi:hypothetical protein